MHNKFSTTIFAFVCSALVVAIAFGVGLSVANMQSASAAEPAAASQQWEYKTVVVSNGIGGFAFGPFGRANEKVGPMGTLVGDNSNGETIVYVRELGKAGWELVAFNYHPANGYEGVMIFKCPIG